VSKLKSLEEAVTQLEIGQPLAYVLGIWEFFGLEFEVTPDVLIPRPETELLVERAIKWLEKDSSEEKVLRVMDVGTGSGCISIALAVNVSDINITATDISAAALNVARKNAERMHVSDRINFIKADLFPLFYTSNPCSLIVANLPYIPSKTLHKSSVYGREPTIALDGGPDGLVYIRRFLEESMKWLLPGGLLLFEIEASEGPTVQLLASRVFHNSLITLFKDLAGRDRLLEVQI
jgi:release factor glutamine methyltransferase